MNRKIEDPRELSDVSSTNGGRLLSTAPAEMLVIFPR
jgi:hypothetical protein